MRRVSPFFKALAILFAAITHSACGAALPGAKLTREVRKEITVDGRALGFAKIPAGCHVIVDSVQGGECIVRREAGDTPFTVPLGDLLPDEGTNLSGTNSAPPPHASPTPDAPPAPEATPPSTPSANPGNTPMPEASPSPFPSVARGQASATPSPAQGIRDPSPEEVNKGLGIPLFGKGSLWAEDDAVVAKRLRWPQESKTTYEAGYRRYPYTYNSGVRVLGADAQSLFLQGRKDRVAGASILFANKGDIANYASAEESSRLHQSSGVLNITDRMMKTFRDTMTSDRKTLEAGLRKLFGDSRPARTGRFANMAEEGQRWDWRGHTFLVTAPRDEYVALRVVPSESFNDQEAPRKAFSEAKSGLAERVERRENGDVIISDLPMVNQGRKGYCVPATFERVLRYYGIPEDMNILAMAGQTGAGGGTDVGEIEKATYGLIRDAGGVITRKNFTGSIPEIKPLIDAGKPILFTHLSVPEFNERVNARMARRVAVSDWEEWRTKTLPAPGKLPPLQSDKRYGHICLIIGYNEKTREIAISDSWGESATERWMTEEEARQIKSARALSVIE
jgi:hypothetical protein